MSDFTLNVAARNDLGKGASRRLRRNANLIPAVIYGGEEAPISVSLETREVAKLLLNDAAFSSILTLNLDGKKQDVLIKDLQRHPAKGFVMHADFIRVIAGQLLTTLVPVHFLNEEDCVGVKLGSGDLLRSTPELEVSCLPQDLPESIEVDVLNLEVGETLHLSQVTAPKGVEFVALANDNDLPIATVQPPRTEEVEETEEAAEAAPAAEEAAED